MNYAILFVAVLILILILILIAFLSFVAREREREDGGGGKKRSDIFTIILIDSFLLLYVCSFAPLIQVSTLYKKVQKSTNNYLVLLVVFSDEN